jgi:hypothetical protein
MDGCIFCREELCDLAWVPESGTKDVIHGCVCQDLSVGNLPFLDFFSQLTHLDRNKFIAPAIPYVFAYCASLFTLRTVIS